MEIISNYLTVNTLNLHYTITGQGPPALLVHGHASSWLMWERLITAYLGCHYRCYALDLPGHGQSDKPLLDWYTLENFTETVYQFSLKLGLKQILLIGHSLGGLISLNLSLNYPNLVTNLILVAPAVKGAFLKYLDSILILEGLVRRPIASQFLKIYYHHPWLAVPGALNTYAHPRMLFTESFTRGRMNMTRCTVQSLFGSYKTIRQADVSLRLAQLQPPALVITGAKDRVVPPNQARMVAELAPRSKLVMIPHAGHLPMDEQPELFDMAMKEYLAISSTPS